MHLFKPAFAEISLYPLHSAICLIPCGQQSHIRMVTIDLQRKPEARIVNAHRCFALPGAGHAGRRSALTLHHHDAHQEIGHG